MDIHSERQDEIYNYVGMVAVLFSSSSVIPQIWKIYKEGTTRSFSILYTIFLVISSACWIAYHAHYQTYYGLLTGGIWLLFSLYITVMIIIEQVLNKRAKHKINLTF